MKEITQKITVVSRPSFPVAGLLGIAFVILKLTGSIGWSWWLVTLPFWGPIALVLGVVGVILCVAFLVFLFAAIAAKFSR